MDLLKDVFASFPTEGEMTEAKEELKHRDHDAAAGREQEGAKGFEQRVNVP